MKRPFGQHFLFDPNILKKIIKCSGVTPDDTVVEIGPELKAEKRKRLIRV